jgi:osmotically-inducible protein OsmY
MFGHAIEAGCQRGLIAQRLPAHEGPPELRVPAMKNFLIALLLGIVLGAAASWYFGQPAVQQVRAVAEQKAADARTAAARAAEDVERTLAAKLEAMELRAQQIRDELQETGRVVRRKAREFGEAVADAAADTRITAEVRRKLAADAELSVFAISVGTIDGRVTLSGTVSSPELIGKAILLALETEGVRDVVSMLQVQ